MRPRISNKINSRIKKGNQRNKCRKKDNQEVNESEDPKITKPNEIMKNPNREQKKNTIHNEDERKGSSSPQTLDFCVCIQRHTPSVTLLFSPTTIFSIVCKFITHLSTWGCTHKWKWSLTNSYSHMRLHTIMKVTSHPPKQVIVFGFMSPQWLFQWLCCDDCACSKQWRKSRRKEWE